jgi:hypothetical protein
MLNKLVLRFCFVRTHIKQHEEQMSGMLQFTLTHHLCTIIKNCRAPLARRLVPFGAVAAADVLNLGITRRDEFLEGIKVFDSHGNEVGQSRLAGARAVSACIAGRIAAAAPILVIPPLVMHRLERAQFYIKRPYLRLPTLIAMLGASIQISVPLCFGIFKQQASVDVVKLESSFHNRVDRFGQPINQVSFNKGI